MNKGSVFIVSGPSGSGKDTIFKKLFARCPEIAFSISSITRAMREGEVEGEKYIFQDELKIEDIIYMKYNELITIFKR